jgi:hypothetical protein
VFVLYLDDSGSAGNTNERYLVLGGVCVFERQTHWVTRELDQLAASVYPESPESVEFHASEVFSGRRPPWHGMTKDKRREVIKDVLRVLARSHASTRAFACAVRKECFPHSDPMELAFEELCNRFDLELKRMYHEDGEPQRGLIILDKSSHETTLQGMARDFRSLGTRWGIIRNLADVPLFVDSGASRPVQLADHVAYAVFRRYEAGDSSYLDIILPKFASQHGKLHGLVHRQTLDPDCLCPACMSRKLAQPPEHDERESV